MLGNDSYLDYNRDDILVAGDNFFKKALSAVKGAIKGKTISVSNTGLNVTSNLPEQIKTIPTETRKPEILSTLENPVVLAGVAGIALLLLLKKKKK